MGCECGALGVQGAKPFVHASPKVMPKWTLALDFAPRFSDFSWVWRERKIAVDARAEFACMEYPSQGVAHESH
jgi:hypothetical protein